jgi:ubiquinone/menaquinone biosynthesis C-methylase UbiE
LDNIILDFGCGNGGFDEILPDRLHVGSWLQLNGGINAYGVDYNSKKIEEASVSITNGTKFYICDCSNLPFNDNSVDSVHCWGTLHHMKNYHDGIIEIFRVLKAGGKFYFVETVDNDCIYKFARRIWGKWQGDEIYSKFTSMELEEDIYKYSTVLDIKYYHRFLISEVFRSFRKEPILSLYINNWYSMLLRVLKLDKKCCCHFMISGIKK